MKLWQKDINVNQRIENFTVGRDRELDLLLATYDIQGSLAHIAMLTQIGLLAEDEYKQLAQALKKLHREAEKGQFKIEEGVEDVHSQVEFLLTEALGDMGKKIHSGRSRNDQVLVDLRLFFRAEIKSIAHLTKALFNQLLLLSEGHKNVLMPGYTHLQVAMVSSFGLWFGAYAESLVEDLRLLESTYRSINQNPLGSAAGYGSSFPLNRKMTTDLLGFDDLSYNVVHAQMGRGKSELFLSFALASLGNTLGKLALDVCLFVNQNFGFISFPEELTTGSSIMPHKKNPDVFELIRGRCNQLQSLPGQISQMTGNLPSGYHRDFQLLKEVIFPGIEQLKDCLEIATFALSQVKVKTDILNDPKYEYLYSVEEVNKEVLNGLPFRDAYRKIGASIEQGTFQTDRKIEHTHEGSIGNLNHEEIRNKMQVVWDNFRFEVTAERIGALLK